MPEKNIWSRIRELVLPEHPPATKTNFSVANFSSSQTCLPEPLQESPDRAPDNFRPPWPSLMATTSQRVHTATCLSKFTTEEFHTPFHISYFSLLDSVSLFLLLTFS